MRQSMETKAFLGIPTKTMNIKAKAHIDPVLEEIVSLCRECNVEWLVLFGSALEEKWHEVHSDFDFGVKFKQHDRPFDKLLWGLMLLLKRQIHLIDIDALQDPFFADVIVTEGKRIF